MELNIAIFLVICVVQGLAHEQGYVIPVPSTPFDFQRLRQPHPHSVLESPVIGHRNNRFNDGFIQRNNRLNDGFIQRNNRFNNGFIHRNNRLNDGFIQRNNRFNGGFIQRNNRFNDGLIHRNNRFNDGFISSIQHHQPIRFNNIGRHPHSTKPLIHSLPAVDLGFGRNQHFRDIRPNFQRIPNHFRPTSVIRTPLVGHQQNIFEQPRLRHNFHLEPQRIPTLPHSRPTLVGFGQNQRRRFPNFRHQQSLNLQGHHDTRLNSGFFRQQNLDLDSLAEIVSEERIEHPDGSYSFGFETSDGTRREEEGTNLGPHGGAVKRGSWSFTYPDGSLGEFSYVADENGFRVQSPNIPPMPAHSRAQVEKAKIEHALLRANRGRHHGSVIEHASQRVNSGQYHGRRNNRIRGFGRNSLVRKPSRSYNNF